MNKIIALFFVLACMVAMSHSLPVEESVQESAGGLNPVVSHQDKVAEDAVDADEALSADREKRQFGYGGYGGGYGYGRRRFYGGGYGGYGGYGGGYRRFGGYGRGYGGYGFYG